MPIRTPYDDAKDKRRDEAHARDSANWLSRHGEPINRWRCIKSEADTTDDGTEGVVFDARRHTGLTPMDSATDDDSGLIDDSLPLDALLSRTQALFRECPVADPTHYDDDAARDQSAYLPQSDHDGPEAIEDAKQALAVTEAAIKALPKDGDSVRAYELKREAFELRTELKALIAKNESREALAVKSLASDPAFVAAVRDENFRVVFAKLIEVVRDKTPGAEFSYAERVAAIGGLFQVAPLVDGADNGESFDDAWLEVTTGLARSTCTELFKAWRELGTDLALLLIGTEDETYSKVQRMRKLSPEHFAAAVEATAKYHTARMIDHAGAKEETARARKFSRSELNIMGLVGMRCNEGMERLEKMTQKQGAQWLAAMLEQHLEWKATKLATEPPQAKFTKKPSFEPSGQTLTQRRLEADHVREL